LKQNKVKILQKTKEGKNNTEKKKGKPT